MTLPASSVEPLAPAWRLPPHVAFPVFSLVLFGFFFAAGAPSPMFLVLQRAWNFSPMMLTVAFAVYVVALLASLLVAGSLSDHVGRRPVLITALVMQGFAMGMFLVAEGIGGLLAARIVQGIATGIATGAMSAAVVESAPASKKKLGATVSSISPLAGLALGGLLTGVAISFSEHPSHVVFGTLMAMFLLAAVAVFFARETIVTRPGLLASLVPRVSIPAKARPDFLRALWVFFTVWAMGGLYLALAPSVMLHVFKIDSGVVNGLTIAVLCGVGAVGPSLLRRFAAHKAAAIGMAAMGLGMVVLFASMQVQSMALFFVATAIAGVGFGGSFAAVVQILAPQAESTQRAELFAGIFTVCYLAFSVPAMLAGMAVKPLGLQTTVEVYAVLLLITAAWGALVLWKPIPAATR